MAITKTNAEIDTAAAAVAAPYGPLTRVTDVEALPEPNSEIQIQFTMASSIGTVYLTWEQMENADQLLALLKKAAGVTAIVQDIKTAIDALDTTMGAYAVPHTQAELTATINTLRNIRQIVAF
jgi:HPt (histidine-containing phosphotransfer) domain-containing protein